MNQAKKPAEKPAEASVEPVTIIGEVHSHGAICPTCHGRGTMADGVHDASCAMCHGTGNVRSADGPTEQDS